MGDADWAAGFEELDAVEARALDALEAGDQVRYRELMQEAGCWPPPMGLSPDECDVLARSDLKGFLELLESNATRGCIVALRLLVEAAYRTNEEGAAHEWIVYSMGFRDPAFLQELGYFVHTFDTEASRACFTAGAALGDVESTYLAGLSALEADDHDGARGWFEKAVELGSDDAMVMLGQFCEDDEDSEQARSWYERAAKHGNRDAVCCLGMLHAESAEKERALEWLDRGAAMGHTGATLYRYLIHPERRVAYALELRDRVADSLELDELGGTLEVGYMGRQGMVYLEDVLFLLSPGLIEAGEQEVAARHRAIARQRYEVRTEKNDIEAMHNLGTLLIEDGEDEAGRAWLEREAQLTDEAADFLEERLGG